MTNLSRRIVAIAAVLLTVGGGTVTWAATSASAASARPATASAVIPRCSPDQLYVWVSPDSANGTAGTTYYTLEFTNISGSECHLYSWPGVSATNADGGQIGVPAIRNADAPAQYINIPAGGTAHSYLGYVDVQVYSGCPRATATFLKVYPPDDTGSRSAFFPLPVCTNGTYDLTIGRVHAGV